MLSQTNPLVPYLARHCAGGILAGWLSLGGLLGTNVGGLRTLIAGSDLGVLAAIMLLIGFAVTFGSVAMGAAVMALGRDEPPTSQKRFRLVWPAVIRGGAVLRRTVAVSARR